MDTDNKLMMTNRLKVVTKYYWGDRFDGWDYLHCHGSVKDAIFYSILLMPEVVSVEDSIILKHRADDEESISRFKECLNKENAVQSEVEASFNIEDVAHIFGNKPTIEFEVPDDEVKLLARIIRDAWDAWLHHLFPERRFVVEYIPPEENGDEVAVTFYQDRS